MNKIKFSHKYPKLWEQTTGRLLYVQVLQARDVQGNRDLIEYDTRYKILSDYTGFEGKEILESVDRFEYYLLPKYGKLIHLTFLGNKNIPFCTIGPFYDTKYNYYMSKLLKEFDIVMNEVE